MNIWLLGDFSENLDEGFKNTGHYLARWIGAAGDRVTCLNIKRIGRPDFWRGLRGARPDIIHTIAQPTHGSLLFTRLLRLFRPGARTVVSALRPDSYFHKGHAGLAQKMVLWFARPDLVLVQSRLAESQFKTLGCPVAFLPGGVDLARFSPASPEQKRYLRQKHGLDPDQPVVLHVGHLRRERNLSSLGRLPGAQIQVIVAGSMYMQTSHDLIKGLEATGMRIFKGYRPNIEEFYQLADCYIFPVRPGQSLSMPLSVLEAMACDLKVLTTRFPGLENAFRENSGFAYIEHADEPAVLSQVQSLLSRTDPPGTRRMVQPYAWESVTQKLRNYYQGLIGK